MPEGEKHFRVVGTLTPELKAKRDAGEEADLDDIQEALEKLSGVEIRLTGSHWISLYTVQQRMANRFRSTGTGRVFIAGDAAHTLAGRRPGHEHRYRGRLQPGMEARVSRKR